MGGRQRNKPFGVMIEMTFCRGSALLMQTNRQSASSAEFTTRKSPVSKQMILNNYSTKLDRSKPYKVVVVAVGYIGRVKSMSE